MQSVNATRTILQLRLRFYNGTLFSSELAGFYHNHKFIVLLKTADIYLDNKVYLSLVDCNSRAVSNLAEIKRVKYKTKPAGNLIVLIETPFSCEQIHSQKVSKRY